MWVGSHRPGRAGAPSPARTAAARRGPARPDYVGNGFRPYLRWKRSTRPAVSTSFCLPVKKG